MNHCLPLPLPLLSCSRSMVCLVFLFKRPTSVYRSICSHCYAYGNCVFHNPPTSGMDYRIFNVRMWSFWIRMHVCDVACSDLCSQVPSQAPQHLRCHETQAHLSLTVALPSSLSVRQLSSGLLATSSQLFMVAWSVKSWYALGSAYLSGVSLSLSTHQYRLYACLMFEHLV